jgi:hypothetical protein
VLLAGALGVLVLIVGALSVWLGSRHEQPAPDPTPAETSAPRSTPSSPPTEQPPPVSEPLRVISLTIDHYEKRLTGGVRHHRLGENVVFPKLGDQVTVEARLNRPAYAYLVGFGPDGKFFHLNDGQPTRKVDVIRYPGPVRNEEDNVRYGLNDGAGLYVFVVVAGNDPLPPFEAVSAELKWSPPPAEAGEMYLYDGAMIETLAPTGNLMRSDRRPGEQAIGASGGVVRAAAGLRKAVPGGRVLAVGFGVGAQ